MSKESHSFSVSVACQIGVNSAIMLQHFIFLQRYSPDGWVKKSAKSIQETYPYLTEKEIRGAIERLCKGGFVFDKIENAVKADRTKSFFVSESGHKLYETEPFALLSNGVPKRANGFDKRANDNFPKGQMLIKEDYIIDSSVVDASPSPPKSAETFSINEKSAAGNTPPNSAPPPPAAQSGWQPFTPSGELEKMRTDFRCIERFRRETGLPESQYETAIADFALVAETITHSGPNDLRQHFFNWARKPEVVERFRPKPQPAATRSPYSAPVGKVQFG